MDIWCLRAHLVSENAHASVLSSSIFVTQSWLIFFTLLSCLDYLGLHRFALVVTETQDVQNVVDARFTRGNVDGVNVYLRSRRSEVTAL